MTGSKLASNRLKLGFGCGGLGGDVSYRESCALVEAAYEKGIRHFDVAPPYGGGTAESILGDVLASVRPEITLVSKCGIAHPRAAGFILSVRRGLKPLKRYLPGLWQNAGQKIRRVAAPVGHFRGPEVLASVEESLRRLRTDHLDGLLLHEVQPADVSEELQAALATLLRDGWVRSVGTASGVAASLELAAQHHQLFGIVQTDHYWGAFRPALSAGFRLITHRVLRTGLSLVRQPWFGAEVAKHGTPELARIIADDSAISTMLVRAAIARAGESGMVLVSTGRRERLPGLMAAVRDDPEPGLTALLNSIFERLAATREDSVPAVSQKGGAG